MPLAWAGTRHSAPAPAWPAQQATGYRTGTAVGAGAETNRNSRLTSRAVLSTPGRRAAYAAPAASVTRQVRFERTPRQTRCMPTIARDCDGIPLIGDAACGIGAFIAAAAR